MSKFIHGQNRQQSYLFPTSLEDAIEADNEVRIIDLFVGSLKLSEYGFRVDFPENGRPAYHPADLLKLYIYGYLNKMRSSRQLEKECKRNIEVMWLLNNLVPDHNTISNFRRDNPKSIKKVFRQTVRISKYFNLIGGTLLAGDSTKFRAQNSKKNNFNQRKIDHHLEYIERKLEEYNQQLAKADGDRKKQIEKQVEKQQERKQTYHKLEEQLNESGQAQVSTSDPDSRQMIIRNNITEVAYNVQTMVDSKHNLPIDYKVTNTNDSKAMGNMLQRTKSLLGTNRFTVLYDKGYHTGSEFETAHRLGIDVMVAIPAKPRSSRAPNPAYNAENFIYNAKNNTYSCPEGEVLTTNGRWHKAENGSLFQQFRTPACKNCQVQEQCTKSKINGKIVQRRKNAYVITANKERIENNKHIYKRRQAIVEHPYGTIKRQWGFSYIITKKLIHHASADVGMMFTAYNLRRLLNIIGFSGIKAYLEKITICFSKIRASIKLYKSKISLQKYSAAFFHTIFNTALNRIYLSQLKLTNGGF